MSDRLLTTVADLALAYVRRRRAAAAGALPLDAADAALLEDAVRRSRDEARDLARSEAALLAVLAAAKDAILSSRAVGADSEDRRARALGVVEEAFHACAMNERLRIEMQTAVVASLAIGQQLGREPPPRPKLVPLERPPKGGDRDP